MVQTGAYKKKIVWDVDQVNILDFHVQAQGYFELVGFGNINIPFPNTLVLSTLQNLVINIQEVQSFYDRVFSYMISNTSLMKLILDQS